MTGTRKARHALSKDGWVRRTGRRYQQTVKWYRRTKKRMKAGWKRFNQRFDRHGKTHCTHCDKWVIDREVTSHLDSHNAGRNKVQKAHVPRTHSLKRVDPNNGTPLSTTTNGKRQSNNGTAQPASSPQGAAPKPQSTNGSQKESTPVTSSGGDEGHENPSAGMDEVVSLFQGWADRYPSNFEANRSDAESMGEIMHGIADAYTRKADMLVDENHFPPEVVEPYMETVQLFAQIADLHKEMADRTEAAFGALIEAMEGPLPRDVYFAKRK